MISLALSQLPFKGPLPPRLWQDIFGLLFTLLALVIAAKLAIPRPQPAPTPLPVATCDLQRESCRLVLPGNGSFDLRLAAAPVAPNRPFSVEFSGASAGIRPLSQEIRGVEIDMGSPSAAFSVDSGGTYRSVANIPLCTLQRMTWRLTVRFESAGQWFEWPLIFQTGSIE